MFINSSSFKNTGFQYYEGLHWHKDLLKDFFDKLRNGESLNENLIHMKVVLILVIIIVNSPLLRQVKINMVNIQILKNSRINHFPYHIVYNYFVLELDIIAIFLVLAG